MVSLSLLFGVKTMDFFIAYRVNGQNNTHTVWVVNCENENRAREVFTSEYDNDCIIVICEESTFPQVLDSRDYD